MGHLRAALAEIEGVDEGLAGEDNAIEEFSASELPNGWTKATLNDLGEYLNGMAFKPSDWRSSGIPIIRIQNLTDLQKPLNFTERYFEEKYRVRYGDLLVSWSATLDAFIWDRNDAVLNQHIFKVTPSNAVDKTFLFYTIKEALVELIESEHLHGSTMKHINRGPFLAHEVTLPPLAEQRRIVAKLDGLLAKTTHARKELDRVPALITHYKKSILTSAFSGELTREWRKKRFPEPRQVPINDICTTITDGDH
jgi:type I restriction enzyme S subunit